MSNSINYGNFDEYLRQSEPHKRERAQTWNTAIGLQAVDGLKPSQYLIETAKRHIEGDLTIENVRFLLDEYYQRLDEHTKDTSTEEADKVSANIAKFLNEKTFTFSPAGYISVHRTIFDGVFDFAGMVRDYNITKKEWVLNGETVLYSNYNEITVTLDYDFAQEKKVIYKKLSLKEIIKNISRFTSNIWQIHAFGEGNTRTTAVYIIKYLRYLGFDVNNEVFSEHSWYFRNALVRANYQNYQKNIAQNSDFLELFFRNIILHEKNELKNRFLHLDSFKYPLSTPQVPPKYPSSTLQLVGIIATKELSIKEMISTLKLKDRKNVISRYLIPAINDNLVCRLYPDNPNHPKQKYILTPKGLELYESINHTDKY